jgi:hypothetical protein
MHKEDTCAAFQPSQEAVKKVAEKGNADGAMLAYSPPNPGREGRTSL